MNGRDTWNRLLDRYLLRFTVGVLVGLFIFLLFADRMLINIPAGYRGVLWDRFGGRTYMYGEGLHLILPWNVLTRYEVRWQNIDRRYVAIDFEGLSIDLQVSTRIRVNEQCKFGQTRDDEPSLEEPAVGVGTRDASLVGRLSRADVTSPTAPAAGPASPPPEPCLGLLHKLFGPDYIERLVIPQIGSQIRAVVGTKRAADIYGRQRELVEDEIMKGIIDLIRRTRFDLISASGIFLREIILPPMVSKAIEDKITQQHVAQEWEFRKQREVMEAERKRQEALGIRDFQDIVSKGISDQYLRWRGIEATLKLAESPNSKIVIIGSGPQGLPIILGNEPVSPPVRPSPPARADAPAELQPSGSAQNASADPPTGPASLPKSQAPMLTPGSTGKDALRPSGSEAKPPGLTAAPKGAQPTGLGSFLNRIMGLDQ
jgi:regulator of protease activity HflC (stomatin/prohibitin superfamily)